MVIPSYDEHNQPKQNVYSLDFNTNKQLLISKGWNILMIQINFGNIENAFTEKLFVSVCLIDFLS